MCGLTAQGGKNAVLEVSNNGQDYSRDGVGLKMVRGRFNRRISIVPSTGPTLGGTLVTILGIETNDEDETGITVRVAAHGSVDRVRRVAKTGALVFVAPSVPAFETWQDKDTLISIHVGHVHVDSVVFKYREAAEVHSISPSFGPLQGETVVVLRGLHFEMEHGLA